jgi:hypothetical protein
MRVRVHIGRLVVDDGSMSRRERMQLSEDIGRELSRLIESPVSPQPGRRRPPSIAAQIATAVAAQLPRTHPHRRTGAHS